MNSLMGYGSDDNSDDSGDNRFPEMPGRSSGSSSKNYRKPTSHEDNYEEVGMDMSESQKPSKNQTTNRAGGYEKPFLLQDSDESGGVAREEAVNHRSTNNSSYQRASPASNRLMRRDSGSRSPKYRKEEEERRQSTNEDRSKDDRYRRRDDRSNRESREDDRSRRDDDKGRDRYRDDRRDRRDDRYAGRDKRDRRRSRSRDKRRSKSPRRVSRSPKGSSNSPKRSRSGSRDRGPRGFTSRREKADKRMVRLDKLGIEFKPDNYPPSAIEEAERNSKSNSGGDRFFMPGITGRFREQIEKRKLLWQKAKEQDTPVVSNTSVSSNVAAASGSKATKVYEATAFADDKTSNKFKRLMGIRATDTSSLPVKSTDVLKKQQEMFSSMEAQYEVARTATHTMRGVGLGFGSFQR